MKRILIVLTVAIASVLSLNAQVTISKKSIDTYKKIKPETIFIQQNKTLIFSGEQLLYKVYCLNKDNTVGISKIAYIELIDENKEKIFQHKIALNLATGYGDFTIPFTVPSGNYKLIGYTQWMRNAGSTNYFVKDIYIINPFAENQAGIVLNNQKEAKQQTARVQSSVIKLQLDKKIYQPRKKVSLEIKTSPNKQSFGNYTLSVKKLNNISVDTAKVTINNYLQTQFNTLKNNFQMNGKSFLIYPPEHKGQLITGKVLDIKSKLPAVNKRVALSIPGKKFVIKIAETNQFGEFYFDLDKEFEGDKAIIQVSDSKRDNYKITLSTKAIFDYSKLQFKKIELSENDLKAIKKKSEYIQIENAYNEVKKDSFIKNEPKVTFYKPDYTYKLDDYKRFPTVHETMIEVIDHTWVTTKRGKHTFFVRDYKSTRKEDVLPLLLIDGVMIQNHEDLYNFNIKDIETINIITDKFLFEKKVYGGVISVLTKKTDFTPISKGSYLLELHLTKPLLSKKYFNQNSSNKAYQRVPDYRTQLLWNPVVNLNTNSLPISFYTPDSKGIFEVKLEGFTFDGAPITVVETIKVE
ncbi:MAG: hypothetical protein HWD85_04290 [Flavobacteriaceae bacterium]|nr:hypothetical protein [Flavobacteriaceae bacterium]